MSILESRSVQRRTVGLTDPLSVWHNAMGVGTGRIAAQFFSQDGKILWRDCNGVRNLKKLFETCAPLAAIINAGAEGFANGKLEILNANTDNYVRGANKDWVKLFEQPNPLQSRKQFLKQLYTYRKLNGWVFGLKIVPPGFDTPSSMWILPPWLIEVGEIKKPFYTIQLEDLLQNVFFVWGGERTPLNPDQLMLFTDNTNTYDDRTWLPTSRVASMKYPISTLLSSAESELSMIQDRGALGIISNRTSDNMGHRAVAKDEIDKLQASYGNDYGLSSQQWKIIFTDADLQYQSIGLPMSELMLHESYVKAIKDLCDGFNWQFPTIAHSDQSTYNNVTTADKNNYQNCIVPDAQDIAEQFVRNLKPENIKFQFDYSDVPALQQSEKERGDGLRALNQALKIEWDNGLITKNMWLEGIGRDTITQPAFEKYKFELTPEELGIIEQKTPGNGSNTNKSV